MMRFLNEPELIFCTQWGGNKYCYLTLIILFSITHSFAQLLNSFKYCYVSVTIQLNISNLFTLSSMNQQFYF